MHKIFGSAVFLTYIMGFLYTISTAYFNAFFLKLGAEPELVTRSFDSILYYSIFVLVDDIFIVSFFTFIIMFMLIIIRSVLIKNSNIKSKCNYIYFKVKKIVKISSNHNFLKLIIIPLLISIVVLSYLLMMVYFEKEGQKEAEKLLDDNFLNQKLALKINNKSIHVLTCDINNCVGIDIKTKEIIYFKKADIFSLFNKVDKAIDSTKEESEKL